MVKRIISKFNSILKSEEQEEMELPKNESGSFELWYDNIFIGQLGYESGQWIFSYSDEFQKQDELRPLIDFPDKSRQYRSEDLWPFFAHRIPGLGQPRVQRIIEREGLDKTNEVALLRHFGYKSISNPYTLNVSP